MPTGNDTGLDYYPLPATGERFPVNDPAMKPVLEPVPDEPAQFLQGIFEGVARIEKRGYDLLEELGADPVSSIRTTGGGAQNSSWTAIRERIVERPMMSSLHEQAAYGTALLAAGLT
jgi:sugar (pentulose or hexulose) kinase